MITLILILMFLILTSVTIYNSAKSINAYQKGVLTVFGEYKRILNPGLNFVPPFVSHIYLYDVREKETSISRQETTRDGKTLDVTVEATYRLENIEEVHKNRDEPLKRVEKKVKNSIVNVLNNEDYETVNRRFETILEREVRSELQETGIELTDVNIVRLNILGDSGKVEETDSNYDFW